MTRSISNMDQLASALAQVMQGMVDQMADKVYETLNFYLQDYYTGWTPSSYRRTYDFLYSAVKTEAKMEGNKCVAYVYIDYDAMDNYVNATGFQVATWANEGLHGGLSVSHKPYVWYNTMKYTVDNGSLLKGAIQYLKTKGFNVKG
ncbi:hypothetical protein [Enterocloster bolteae]|uniref:hypothetical protein n=1 Tax=Enterocloster bolteae TaxID=208479 RepID=UPI0018A01D2D|nr:hypothetical protein [Enterocloster bolteae]